jgi:hypothetical protein
MDTTKTEKTYHHWTITRSEDKSSAWLVEHTWSTGVEHKREAFAFTTLAAARRLVAGIRGMNRIRFTKLSDRDYAYDYAD